MSDTFERVKKVCIKHLGSVPDEVRMDASFREDLYADSLDEIELVMAFEEEFGFEIPDEVAATILTVGDAVKYIDRQAART